MAARVRQLEESLVADLFYVFQGLDGSHVKYSVSEDRYTLDPMVALEIPLGYRTMVLQLSELGWVHRRCLGQLEELETLYHGKKLGLIDQSFLKAVKEELNQYYKALAAMDAHNKSCSDSANKLTLRRVLFWSREPLQHVKLICAFMESTKAHGAGLLTSLSEFSLHGNPAFSSLFKRLLYKSSLPLFNIILTWVFEGTIEDPYNEFFIKNNQKCSDNHEDLWHAKYYLPYTSTGDVQCLPPYVTVPTAEAILRVGKSINFMKSCGRQVFFTAENGNIEENSRTELMNPKKEITERTFEEMTIQQFYFLDHVEAIKNFIFLGRDDFAQHIILGIEAELDKPVGSIYRHNVALTIDRVLRTPSNASLDEKGILENIKVVLDIPEPSKSKKEDGEPEESSMKGWDVFSLEYTVVPPLDAVFIPSITRLHNEIAHVVMKARRAYHCLNKLWSLQADGYHKLKTVFEVQPVLHRSYLLQHEMRNFISHFLGFANYNVIDQSWKEFKYNVQHSVSSFDGLIEEYQKWIDNIAEFLTYGNRDSQWNNYFRLSMDVIIQFWEDQMELFESALRLAESRKQQAIIEVLEIKENLLDEESDDAQTEAERVFRRNLNQIYIAKFNKVYKEFRVLLTKLGFLQEYRDGDLVISGLQEMSFKLNFNNFYKKLTK